MVMRGLILCMCTWLIFLQSAEGRAETAMLRTGPVTGSPVPELTGHTLNGKAYRLQDDTAHLKVVNFFWIECLPCKQEMPELRSMENEFTEVQFISVHTRDEPDWVIAQFVKSLAGSPSTIVIPAIPMREVFNYAGLPHTIVLDKNNTVLLNLIGFSAENMNSLRRVLNENR